MHVFRKTSYPGFSFFVPFDIDASPTFSLVENKKGKFVNFCIVSEKAELDLNWEDFERMIDKLAEAGWIGWMDQDKKKASR